jgi:ubiquitin carboxyl-terminal hydrolase 25
MEYFTHFWNIIKAMQDVGEIPPPELQHLVMLERERLRFTSQDLVDATRALGFGSDGPLGVEFEDDVPEDFIINAWRDALKRAWKDTERGSELQRTATQSFRVIADARGSAKLRKMWEDAKGKTMTPERAYDILEIPKEVDDAMLLTVFQLRVGRWFDALLDLKLTNYSLL